MIRSPSEIGGIPSEKVLEAAEKFDTPLYLYDAPFIEERCNELLGIPNAFGLTVRYAMKANSNRSILRLIVDNGLQIDASSLNEVRRAESAGISLEKIMLTTQEVPENKDRTDLEEMITRGLKYNVCSVRQLELIADFASQNKIPLSIRVHPGVGSGESSTRNTGDKYSCFGVHLTDLEEVLEYVSKKKLMFKQVHSHVGSGGDPKIWRENIDRMLNFVDEYFPDAESVSFGGGLKEARMLDEESAEVNSLGEYAHQAIEDFSKKTGRNLHMEIEPGTYIVANSGYIVSKVVDLKQTGPDGFRFVVLDAGMEMNTRPLLYGSSHPFYVVSKQGDLKQNSKEDFVVVGSCCESGDSQTLDSEGNLLLRPMPDPEIGDYVVIGGCGAYCSTMSPFNYNSHLQAQEVLFSKGDLRSIRKRQTLGQITENED